MWLALALSLSAHAGPDDEEEPAGIDFAAELVAPSPVRMRAKMDFGATPGGAQDVGYVRDRVAAGAIPLPEAFTSEGLLSEHDLPLAGAGCTAMICTNAKAVRASLPTQPAVTHLVQLGFDSGLTEATFRRDPLHIVAVIDQSCSMSGPPIETVRASLETLVRDHLGPADELSIVLYGSGTTTWLEPTPVRDVESLATRIRAIPIDGSTNLEAGLQQGFALARANRRRFDGTTRLMLFTDERPNTGNTDPEGFMGLARAGSADGIGMTTFGVGAHFGAELASAISAVRGGNLFFFPDAAQMTERFAEDFDTMVTELAYDLQVDVAPADGLRIAGVYGVPGDLVDWDGEHLRLTVETLFLSRSRGGIYLALAPEEGARTPDGAVASVGLAYEPRHGAPVTGLSDVRAVAPTAGDEGLTRGVALVDMATTLSDALQRYHHDNDADGAWQRVRALQGRFAGAARADGDLAAELTLLGQLEANLAKAAGRAGEPTKVVQRDPVSGLPY